MGQQATAVNAAPPSSCSHLVASLEHARDAVGNGDAGVARTSLAMAYADAIDLYGRLDPTRSVVCAHLQSLLETCIARIEFAQRNPDGPALDAALKLVQPLQSMLAHLID